MAQGGSEGRGSYVAFISYSHRDFAIGRWLHRRLESYRIPKRLVGVEGERGPVPARLTPIFRDRDEFAVASDLSEKVRAALAISDNLIVVCSPNAAASLWVAKEISTFRELHPGAPIFSAIVEGEPSQCFPPALREGGIEPLAADLRKEGDGRRLGVLKLVAGLSGVGLDALVQRDAQRHLRRVTAITLGAVAAMLVMAVLTILALSARAEAERQRAEAEGLVEFMFTDLRDKLREVGRLDVLEPVNRRALSYYAAQGDSAQLPAASQARRAGILHALGEDDERRGNIDRAEDRFAEAHAATARVLAGHARDPDAIYYHAQSEYWVGYMTYLRKDWSAASRHWRGYQELADRLAAVDPKNPRSLREIAYSEGNLCTLALAAGAEAQQALGTCQTALAGMQRLHALMPGDQKTTQDLANRHAWVGGAWKALGDSRRALAHFEAHERLLEPIARRLPGDAKVQDQWLRVLMTRAEYLYELGRTNEARHYNDRALAVARTLTRLDPANARWRKWTTRIDALHNKLTWEK